MERSVFSEYELKKIGLKFKGADAYNTVECVGSCEEEMESKVITKSCRGIVKKKIVKGTGNGTLKYTMHIPYADYTAAYGMELDTLIEGVKAYGSNSVHKEFSIVEDVFDEDGIEKFKAYPKCVIETGVTRKIENGAEEVAEIELEVSVMPDEYGNGVYEALAADLKDETVKSTWMTAFTPDLVKKVTEA